jgi:isochorismate pyruvate lyase
VIRSPYECESLSQVRREIDRLDRGLVHTLRLRAEYVAAAAGYKTTDDSVRADDRVARVLADRREWAECDGVSAELVENIYRLVTAHAIEQEREHIARQRAEAAARRPEPARDTRCCRAAAPRPADTLRRRITRGAP